MELIVMAVILAAVLVVQYLVYAKNGLKHVTYTLTISTPEAFEGDEIEVVEEIENAKALPLPWIRTEISCSRWLCFSKDTAFSDKPADSQRGLVSSIFVLKGRQKCRRSWRVRCEKRGVFSIEDVSVSVSDLFGLCRPSMVVKLRQTVRVLPTPTDMECGALSTESFIGDNTVQRFVLPDPFVISGAKEYTGREPMNRIHWAQTARTGTLMAYCNEFTTERRMLIVLNMQREYHRERDRLTVSVLEAQIKAAAFMLDYCYKTRTECAMAINAAKPLVSEHGEGYEHTVEALRTLAELKNGCGQHIDDFMAGLDFHRYTDVVYIGNFISEKTAEILSGLSQSGKCCGILSTEPLETDFCEVCHIPRGRYYPPEGGDDYE